MNMILHPISMAARCAGDTALLGPDAEKQCRS
ncbi:Protein of unknown function [Pyronema omphalodes CBS 100304]|uniref:Uncharacterized protein n=1 Tax=Pyronema omphalodes (strain CBS 100304) TaxID=1076935 RepID=U4L5J8_PYROM|nr:Protein of unknown function [Pyronema omphalodes CBS 100304]